MFLAHRKQSFITHELFNAGTGAKRVYQFKIIEKEPWGQEPKQLAKLGSVDLKVIKFLRKEIADRVASKF